MKKLSTEHTHFTSENAKFPTGLKTLDEISGIINMESERIKELTDSQYLPHWRIDNGSPLFQIREVKEWIANNLINRIKGRNFPINLKPMIEPPVAVDAPASIKGIDNLRMIPLQQYPPGVYFLVSNNEVVYIGQSKNPMYRIQQHTDKVFSYAYMIPIPLEHLDAVEGALIRIMNPKLNSGDKKIANGPGERYHDENFLIKYGIKKLSKDKNPVL